MQAALPKTPQGIFGSALNTGKQSWLATVMVVSLPSQPEKLETAAFLSCTSITWEDFGLPPEIMAWDALTIQQQSRCRSSGTTARKAWRRTARRGWSKTGSGAFM